VILISDSLHVFPPRGLSHAFTLPSTVTSVKEVPVERLIEKIVEVPVINTVEVPVERVVERIVEARTCGISMCPCFLALFNKQLFVREPHPVRIKKNTRKACLPTQIRPTESGRCIY